MTEVEDWFYGLDQVDRAVVLACIHHSIEDEDFDLDPAGWGRAEEIMRELDQAMNGAPTGAFVAAMPGEARAALWASAWAFVRDVHAPQDQLTEAQWGLLDAIHRAASAPQVAM